jgi:HEPN domain-containing protein
MKNISEMVDYWVKSSQEDLKTAIGLYRLERYHHCLFFCHLFVEKIIKALVVKVIGQPAPYGHKLSKLAKLTKVSFSNRQLDLLDELTAFNIEARYNDYKLLFFRKATKEYTQEYLKKAKQIYLWLKKKL